MVVCLASLRQVTNHQREAKQIKYYEHNCCLCEEEAVETQHRIFIDFKLIYEVRSSDVHVKSIIAL